MNLKRTRVYIIYRRVLCPYVHRLHRCSKLTGCAILLLLRCVYERRGISEGMAPSCVYPAMPRINNGLEIAFAADRYCPSVPETTKTFSRDTYWLVREGGRRHSAPLVSYFCRPCKDGRLSSGSYPDSVQRKNDRAGDSI